MTLTSPVPLAEHHELVEFDSGVPELDDWLHRQASQSGERCVSYVRGLLVRVLAYYALASGAVSTPEAPGRFKRNMPDPIPGAILGRVAIDRTYQGRGIGLRWCYAGLQLPGSIARCLRITRYPRRAGACDF